MKHLKMAVLLASGMLATLTNVAKAESSYPERPITVVTPVPAGGSGDAIARLYAAKLRDALGQSVVVENRAGANTAIGASLVARSAPDGYTLLLTGGPTFTVNPALYRNLSYDAAKDFRPLGIIGAMPMVLVENASHGAGSYAALVERARAQPGSISYSSFGNGSMPHITGEDFSSKAGIKLLHVPYKGSAPALTDLMGKQIDLSIDSMVAVLPQVRSGTLRALAVASAQRSTLLPDVPTFSELGLEGFVHETWIGVVAPAKVPDEIAERLEAALGQVSTQAEVQQQLQALGFRSEWQGSTSFAAKVQDELARNTALIKAAGIEQP